jgi:hypothetical protein
MTQHESFEIHYKRALRALAPAENMRLAQVINSNRLGPDEVEPPKNDPIDVALLLCLRDMGEATINDLMYKMRKRGYQLTPKVILYKMQCMSGKGLVHTNLARETDVRIWQIRKDLNSVQSEDRQ